MLCFGGTESIRARRRPRQPTRCVSHSCGDENGRQWLSGSSGPAKWIGRTRRGQAVANGKDAVEMPHGVVPGIPPRDLLVDTSARSVRLATVAGRDEAMCCAPGLCGQSCWRAVSTRPPDCSRS